MWEWRQSGTQTHKNEISITRKETIWGVTDDDINQMKDLCKKYCEKMALNKVEGTQSILQKELRVYGSLKWSEV